MIKHYIIMSSSYTDGSRVALDITEDCFLNSKAIAEMIEEIRKNCGKDVPLSTHFIETESASWDSVVAYDPFFEDVECTKSTTAFSEKIKKVEFCQDWTLQITFFQKFGVRIFHWKNSFIMHMRITSVSILSGYLKITFMHSVMVLSLTVSMRLLSEVAPNM